MTSTKQHYHSTDAVSWHKLKNFAKENRKTLTGAETIVWERIRKNQLGVRFRRQHIIGTYIADFICVSEKLVIEIDGPIHETKKMFDQYRTRVFEDQGYTVLRFTNDEVMKSIDKIVDIIRSVLKKPHPTAPSPKERGSNAFLLPSPLERGRG